MGLTSPQFLLSTPKTQSNRGLLEVGSETNLELWADCGPSVFASTFQGILVVAAWDVFEQVIDEVESAWAERRAVSGSITRCWITVIIMPAPTASDPRSPKRAGQLTKISKQPLPKSFTLGKKKKKSVHLLSPRVLQKRSRWGWKWPRETGHRGVLRSQGPPKFLAALMSLPGGGRCFCTSYTVSRRPTQFTGGKCSPAVKPTSIFILPPTLPSYVAWEDAGLSFIFHLRNEGNFSINVIAKKYYEIATTNKK